MTVLEIRMGCWQVHGFLEKESQGPHGLAKQKRNTKISFLGFSFLSPCYSFPVLLAGWQQSSDNCYHSPWHMLLFLCSYSKRHPDSTDGFGRCLPWGKELKWCLDQVNVPLLFWPPYLSMKRVLILYSFIPWMLWIIIKSKERHSHLGTTTCAVYFQGIPETA